MKLNTACTLLLMIVIMAVFHCSDLDLRVQDYCYNFVSNAWRVDASEPVLKFIFYRGLKLLIVSMAVILLILCLCSRKIRKKWLVVLLSIIFVPLIVAGSKQFTNAYCPAQIERYHGSYPYVKLLSAYPADFTQSKMGKCFPAGHATAGYALMSLYFVFIRPGSKYAGLAVGIVLGWVMGGYQMLKGAHYLSDTIFTMLASWLIILIIQMLIKKSCPDTN